MSRLQRKNIHKRHLLWVKLFGICLFFHIIFLWWIFCIYRDNSYVLSLSVHKNFDYSAPVVFVPAYVSSTHKTTADKPLVMQTATKTTAQNNTPKRASAPKTEMKKTTTVANTPVKKVDNPKPALNTSIAMADVKKIESSFEPSSAKASEATQAFTPEQSRSIRTNGGDIAKALDIEQKITPVIPENAQVSDNYRQVEALRMQAQLQKEIVQTWKPPIGVSPDCSCDVSFFVTTTGTLNHIKMVKPSGVMMFDISARQALCATKMPHWTYGKTITITFKQ